MSKTSKYLEQHLLADVVEGRAHAALMVPETASVQSVLDSLASHNFQAVPVYRGDTEHPQAVGVISLMEIMSYLVFGLYFRDRDASKAAKLDVPADLTIGTIVASRVTDEASKVWMFEASSQLATVVDVMAKGVHRVIVPWKRIGLEPQSSLGLITQTDIVRHLLHVADHLDDGFLNQSLQAVMTSSSNTNFVVAAAGDIALDVYARMAVEGIYAVPVVDADNRVLGCLSSSDLKGLGGDLTSLTQNCLAFINSRSHAGPTAPVTANADSSIKAAMTAITAARVHRIWVVSAEGALVGSVTLSDILKAAISDY